MKKEIKKLLKIKGIKVLLGLLAVGIVLTNFWTLVWWAVVGTVATVIGIVGYSFYEAAKEAKAKE